MPNYLKAILLAPFAIALGFAVMILSYILVPLFIVAVVVGIIYLFLHVGKKLEEEDEKSNFE